MKTYEAKYKQGETIGVYGISLVENPAMQGHFIALSQTEVQLKTVDEEKRILIGLVLEPNKPIYRNQGGEEFNVLFAEETIKELAYAFYKGGFHQNSSVEHSKGVEGVTFVESWLIEDSDKDKSAALGLSYPKGSWMATLKVDSDEVWNDYVKTGKVKGFSVDALVSLEEVKTKSNIEMSKEKSVGEQVKDTLLSFFGLKPGETLELGKIKTANSEVEIQFEGDTMEVGGRVWVNAEDGTEVPLPVGEYELDDKRVLVVTEEGKIGEVKEKPEPAPASTEPQPATMTAKEQADVTEQISNAIKSVLIKYSEDLDKKFTTYQEAVDKKILELAEQPATKPIKATLEQAAPTTARGRLLAEIQNT